MCFRVENGIQMGEGAFKPPHKTQAIGLAIELEAPFLPVGLGKIKVEISRPRVVGHKMFADGDVTRRSGDGIQTHSGGGIQSRGGPSSRGSGLRGSCCRQCGGARGCGGQPNVVEIHLKRRDAESWRKKKGWGAERPKREKKMQDAGHSARRGGLSLGMFLSNLKMSSKAHNLLESREEPSALWYNAS